MRKLCLLVMLLGWPSFILGQSVPSSQGESQIPVTFSGGFDTYPQDHGRPVILIASALNVPSEVFRKAFSQVVPAAAGEHPEEAQVRKNKEVLLSALHPYKVTNDRLDEVSNYYRYNRSNGEMWKHTPAVAYATVRDGVITGFTITDPGSGYSSPPHVTIPGMEKVETVVTLDFETDLKKNGSIKTITTMAPPNP